jgi:hypothetical protein
VLGGKPIQQEDQIMFNRSAVITACGALLGLVVAAGTIATLSASPRSNRLEYLTFSGPVGLPGVTLGGGTYTFEVANPEASADIIRVRSRATDEAVFLGFTKLAERPKGMASNRSILLGESPRGIAPPIIGWYPTGDVMGHEFVYGKKAR